MRIVAHMRHLGRYWLAALVAVVLILVVGVSSFHWGPSYGNYRPFRVSLESKSAYPIESKRALLIYEIEWWYTWLLPENYPKFGEEEM